MPYRWIRRLGRGAFGEVWAADREGRRIAVKVLHQRHDERSIDALRRETRFGAVVAGHPGIVAVRDVLEFGGVTYLEMDFVDGPSLDRVLAARLASGRGPLPASIVRRFAVEVLDALGWAASAVSPNEPGRFVHRDVKPANLLLGPNGRIRLSDFGVARAHAGLGLQTTATGIAKGTPRFMAPELLAERHVDGRADQFALGATMFELLSGVPLYDGQDLAEVLLAALQANVARRMPLAKAPPALVRVIERMLAREAYERFPSHLEARRALEAVAVPGPTVEDELPELLFADRSGETTDTTDVRIGLVGAQTLELRANALPTLSGDPPTQPNVYDEVLPSVEPDPTTDHGQEDTSRSGQVVLYMEENTLPERIVEALEPPRRRPSAQPVEDGPAPPPLPAPRPLPAPPVVEAPAGTLSPEDTLERPVFFDGPGEATLILDRPDWPVDRPRDRARAERRRRDAVRLIATGLLFGFVGGGTLIAVAVLVWVLTQGRG